MATMMNLLTAVATLCLANAGKSGDNSDISALQRARDKFNSISNGCYTFQYSQSCFCLPCSTQSMDVKVINDEVQYVTFAEGDSFAFDNFCGGNQDAFDGVLESSARTMDALFDLIEDAVTRGLPFDVKYHDKIGVPLSIFIDRVPGAVDDEVQYNLHCLYFDECGYLKVDGKMKKFNEKDKHSCANIGIPEQCPLARFQCTRFYDGCNTCSCDGEDVMGCSMHFCDDYGEARCMDCESNTEWSPCGHAWCDPTCEDVDNVCGIRFILPPECTEPRCQCPDTLPRWDGFECVSESECTPSPIIGQPFCKENCKRYTDGCQTCECDEDGNAVQCVKDALCIPGFEANAQCLECQDEDSMTYTDCGTCSVTCEQYLDGEILACITMCQQKCECNKETPLYLASEARCISEDECESFVFVSTESALIDDLEAMMPEALPNRNVVGSGVWLIPFICICLVMVYVTCNWMCKKYAIYGGYEKIGGKKVMSSSSMFET